MVEPPPVLHPALDIVEDADKSVKIGGIYIPPPPVPALTTNPTEPRLIITDLTIKNFKSYAGSQKLGPFHKNFTSVIGPNGSGKSNVIDALLFVFGYRAQKIRSKKISILIHKSERYPNVASCTVIVHFAMIKDKFGEEKFVRIPNSEFTISRTGYKDNSSSYEINGKKSQYKEVSKLLQKYGIDLEYSRFLILQGEIELISMMKPKGQGEGDIGMLEYMEDIIGSNRYIEPIQHFNTKVEELNNVKVEKMNHLKIVEKELKDIEGPKNEAVDYLKLENKLISIENTMLQIKLKEADDDLQSTIKEKNELAEQMKTCLLKQEEIQLKRKLQETALEKINASYDGFMNAVEKYKDEYHELERKDVVCRENLNFNKEKMKKLVKNLDTEEKTLNTLKKQPIVLKSEAAELEVKLKNLELKKVQADEKMTEVMRTLRCETVDMQEEKDKIELQLIPLNTKKLEAQSKMHLAKSELELAHANEKREMAKLEDYKKEYARIQGILDERAEILKEAKIKIPEAETKLALSKKQLVEAEEGEKKLSKELRHKRIKLEELKSSFESVQHQNAVVKAFHEQRKQGKFKGVLGRLGDLATIDDVYDVAMSTACGALDNIVTDTISTAQECVEFLKANNLGYVTFMALDKMEQWEPYTRQKISTPENVPRLFDLINVPNKDVLPAFYFALRDTLVAKDLEQATRISLQGSKRNRTVTMNGEVIDISGTMSGGGGRPLRGRMGKHVINSDITQEQLDSMTAEVDEMRKNVFKLMKDKTELEMDIDRLAKEIDEFHHSIRKSEMELNNYSETKKMVQARIGEQHKIILEEKPDPKYVAEMEKKIADRTKIYEKAKEVSDVVEEKVKGLKEKIMAITKGKFNAAQKPGEKISKEIDEVRRAMTKTTVSIKSSERKVLKCEEKVTSFQESIEDLKKAKEALKSEFDSLTEKATIVADKRNEALNNAEECKGKKAEFVKEIQTLNKNEHQLKSDNIEYKNNFKCAESHVKEKQSNIKAIKTKLSKLKLHDVEDLGDNPLPTYTLEEIAAVSLNVIGYEQGVIQAQMDNMKPDLNAIYEYKRKDEIFKMKQSDLDDTIRQRDLMKYYYEELRKRRLCEFMRGFTLLATKLKEIYQMLTLGGDAELELVDSLDPFSLGIMFSVRPPKKSWKKITNLSGGEKTLSSLALVFALHYYRPTPFYVMDEIDAALDFRNVSIVGCFVNPNEVFRLYGFVWKDVERTSNAQFIIISLRNTMFELSNRLIGIFKVDNCTSQITLMDIDKMSRPSTSDAENEDETNAAIMHQFRSHIKKNT